MGLARARMQPVAQTRPDGSYEFVPRLLLPVILAFDHRVLDGAEAARFTRKVIEELENPERLLMML
jgi:pyruvate dehydrogenase E2 component (dihydrolipoamide acetyltransferase)